MLGRRSMSKNQTMPHNHASLSSDPIPSPQWLLRPHQWPTTSAMVDEADEWGWRGERHVFKFSPTHCITRVPLVFLHLRHKSRTPWLGFPCLHDRWNPTSTRVAQGGWGGNHACVFLHLFCFQYCFDDALASWIDACLIPFGFNPHFYDEVAV